MGPILFLIVIVVVALWVISAYNGLVAQIRGLAYELFPRRFVLCEPKRRSLGQSSPHG